MKFGTKAVHAGVEPDPSTGAIMTPIFQTSTYVQEEPGVNQGYAYARGQNPTRDALEASLAALENANHALVFGSGLAAVDAIGRLLKPGDEIITSHDIYGGTFRLFNRFYEPNGIKCHYIDLTRPEEIEKVINDRTRLIWIETPTNPLMQVVDIEAVCKAKEGRSLITVVDNTFATPYLQQPLDLGADVVMHSATKYLGGHSDLVMGALMLNDAELFERLRFVQFAIGAIPGPMDCFLVLRGIKTLHVRVDRACDNARKVAHFLRDHPKVDTVNWPGFEDHRQYLIAKKQMSQFGAMLSFTLAGDDLEEARIVLSSTRIFALAESLGGVESLISNPAIMTHASVPKEVREAAGLKDSLIRLSVGIEDAEDLLADLEQAIGKVS